MHIGEIQLVIPKPTVRNQRTEVLKQLYELYISQPEFTRTENRKRYHNWVRVHHPDVCKKSGFSKEKYDQFKPTFKKAKLPIEQRFISYIPEDKFWVKFTHLKGEEGLESLRYMVSMARDKSNRGENIASFIMGSVK